LRRGRERKSKRKGARGREEGCRENLKNQEELEILGALARIIAY
jgi:hypothetical protein